jgi:hypothetical protein
MPTIDSCAPHFAARVSVRQDDEAGPVRAFPFPESGTRNVPLSLAGVTGLNTVQLRSNLNAQIAPGATPWSSAGFSTNLHSLSAFRSERHSHFGMGAISPTAW